MPVWDELSKKYSDDKVIFKKVNMELENNKYLGQKYNITSYPTVYLHTATGKDIKYNGERNLQTLTSFLDKHLESK